MPLITTHMEFAKDILKSINLEIKNTIKNENIYKLASLGTDPFIFYEFFKTNKKDLQHIFHTNNTDTFFLEYIKKIKEKKLLNNPQIISFLYGSLTHYVLDSHMHPFVVYKTGQYNKSKPQTIKYKGLHNKMEMHIDSYLYQKKYNLPYKDFKIHKTITKEKLDKDLINILNELYLEIYNVENGGTKYNTGNKIMYYSYKFLIEDKLGIKKQIYHFIDKITPKKENNYENYNSNIKNLDLNFLNLDHKEWLNPWDKSIKKTDSFFDIYENALTDAKKLFIATNNYLNDNISENDYKKVLKDKSYLTGLSWHKELEMKYLEF